MSSVTNMSVLEKKAEAYIDALFLEIGMPLDQTQARALQVALLQDFIEVYNLGHRAHSALTTVSPDGSFH